jgi:glycosyltransferase involved in cell wall biosynthesis
MVGPRFGERSVRVWIVGDNFGFPNGTGATARVHGFARALASAGAEVRVFCLTPTELADRDVLNRDTRGVHDGVAFEYACGSTTLPAAWFERRWLRVRSMLRLRAAAREPGRAPDVVLATAQTLSGLFTAERLARSAGARCVLDACELPSNFVPEGPRRARHARLYAAIVRRLAGVVCISTALERHWATHAGVPILRVPILLDVAGTPTQHDDGSGRIVYAGNLEHGDEVRALVASFAALASDEPAARLQIFGGSLDPAIAERFRALAGSLGVGARVEFAGFVERARVARAIASARVLALPRPRTPWAEAGLSAKLADYLATARPVVVTAIGDVPLYLEDGVSAFVVPPEDGGAFAAALRAAFDDPARADAIGRRGREAALAHFDVRVHGPRLLAFFSA